MLLPFTGNMGSSKNMLYPRWFIMICPTFSPSIFRLNRDFSTSAWPSGTSTRPTLPRILLNKNRSDPTWVSACSCSQCAAFLSQGGTPSSHPFTDRSLHRKKKNPSISKGYPHDYAKCRSLSLFPKTPRPCLNPLSGASSVRRMATRISLVGNTRTRFHPLVRPLPAPKRIQYSIMIEISCKNIQH